MADLKWNTEIRAEDLADYPDERRARRFANDAVSASLQAQQDALESLLTGRTTVRSHRGRRPQPE